MKALTSLIAASSSFASHHAASQLLKPNLASEPAVEDTSTHQFAETDSAYPPPTPQDMRALVSTQYHSRFTTFETALANHTYSYFSRVSGGQGPMPPNCHTDFNGTEIEDFFWHDNTESANCTYPNGTTTSENLDVWRFDDGAFYTPADADWRSPWPPYECEFADDRSPVPLPIVAIREGVIVANCDEPGIDSPERPKPSPLKIAAIAAATLAVTGALAYCIKKAISTHRVSPDAQPAVQAELTLHV